MKVKKITWHACNRWTERVDPTSDPNCVRGLIKKHARRAVTMPFRLGRTLSNKPLHRRSRKHKESLRYIVTSTAVLLIGGRTVVTVYKMTLDALADILVWLLLGQWVRE